MTPTLSKPLELPAEALETLQQFEDDLDPAAPEGGPLQARVIGYGEMSTVFAFGAAPHLADIAFKRMALFHTVGEAEEYLRNYYAYNEALVKMGIDVPRFGAAQIQGRNGRIVLYLAQGMLEGRGILHQVIRRASEDQALRLFDVVLAKTTPVFEHNQSSAPDEGPHFGFDGQLSNWAIVNPGSESAVAAGPIKLAYIDTSTPLIRIGGQEQLDPELFLRVCPATLVWVIRWFFLKDVVDRYYDLRLVIVDLIANLNKEQRADLIDPFISRANEFLGQWDAALAPISAREVRAYYKEDARIWSLFLGLRRLERRIRLWTGGSYDLILPGPVAR